MQVLSHQCRAYIHNANGLHGFLIAAPDIMQLMQSASSSVVTWQTINCQVLTDELSRLQTFKEKMAFISDNHPSLYLHILKQLGLRTLAQKYRRECKALERKEPLQYSKYILGYWIPWLEKQRAKGKLTQGKSTVAFQSGI